MKELNATEKRIAKAAIQRNAFHAHPDNLLLAMLADEGQSGQSGSSTTDQTQSRSSMEQTQSEENLEDVEIEGYSDDEASGDEAEDKEYPQDKISSPLQGAHPKVSGKDIY